MAPKMVKILKVKSLTKQTKKVTAKTSVKGTIGLFVIEIKHMTSDRTHSVAIVGLDSAIVALDFA